MRHVGIGKSFPILVEVVTNFRITSKLFELAVRSVAICPLVLSSNDAVELAHTETVHAVCLKRSVAAALQRNVRLAPVLIHLSRDNIHDATHRVAAVKQTRRATKHFDFLRH